LREAWIAWTAIQAERVVTSVVELTKADQELKLWPGFRSRTFWQQKVLVVGADETAQRNREILRLRSG